MPRHHFPLLFRRSLPSQAPTISLMRFQENGAGNQGIKNKSELDLVREIRAKKEPLKEEAMNEKLTDMQMRILSFLKAHQERTGEIACYLDDFFEGMSPEELIKSEGLFQREVGELQNKGYIKTVDVDFQREGMEFGCYQLTRKGLKAI